VLTKVSSTEVMLTKVRLTKVGTTKIRLTKVRLTRLRLAQIISCALFLVSLPFRSAVFKPDAAESYAESGLSTVRLDIQSLLWVWLRVVATPE